MASTNSWTLELESKVSAPRMLREMAASAASDTTIVAQKKVEFLDVDKCECRYTLECDGVETSTWSIKMKPTTNGGSVAKVECTSKGVQDNDMMLKAKDSAAEMLKNVEAYLIANPDAYNTSRQQTFCPAPLGAIVPV
ncbi:pathogenesis-related protein 1-like [Lolium perenne]|uniref:pathogenesis-related protein 1-like n=1 Tax=Lolium perenne TaxID=4522 RepID=UPI003A99BEF3